MTRHREQRPVASRAVRPPFVIRCIPGSPPDNGATWGADETTSDVVSPLPLQGDPGIQPLYAGDYDYGSAILTKHVDFMGGRAQRH